MFLNSRKRINLAAPLPGGFVHARKTLGRRVSPMRRLSMRPQCSMYRSNRYEENNGWIYQNTKEAPEF
jgi:hypothetical protein